MAIIAKKPDNDFKKVEPGSYVARCFSMIEIGTIETEFKGQKKKQKKVMLTWELPDELDIFDPDKGPQPYAVSKTYTLSMFKDSNLRKDLEGWRGKGFTEEEAEAFDITVLIGKPCMLSVIHQPGKDDPSKSYVLVSSISRLMKNTECPKQVNPTRVLSFDEFNWDIYNSLSDYLKEKIASSDEFQLMQEPEVTHTDEVPGSKNEDDSPF
jgi:hypothetical protein